MTKNQKAILPKWYWALTGFFLVWNLMGIISFFQHTFISEESLQTLPTAIRELYESYPLWTKIVFAIAVFGGTLGSIGLLVRKKWAKIAFIISLLAIIPQMLHNLFMTKAIAVYGPGSEVMPIMVILVGIFLVWFSHFGIKKNWLL